VIWSEESRRPYPLVKVLPRDEELQQLPGREEPPVLLPPKSTDPRVVLAGREVLPEQIVEK
jgi:hypothetical protein